MAKPVRSCSQKQLAREFQRRLEAMSLFDPPVRIRVQFSTRGPFGTRCSPRSLGPGPDRPLVTFVLPPEWDRLQDFTLAPLLERGLKLGTHEVVLNIQPMATPEGMDTCWYLLRAHVDRLNPYLRAIAPFWLAEYGGEFYRSYASVPHAVQLAKESALSKLNLPSLILEVLPGVQQ